MPDYMVTVGQQYLRSKSGTVHQALAWEGQLFTVEACNLDDSEQRERVNVRDMTAQELLEWFRSEERFCQRCCSEEYIYGGQARAIQAAEAKPDDEFEPAEQEGL